MNNRQLSFSAIVGLAISLANVVLAAVPGPPVNQTLGMRDVLYSTLTEADCRGCHASGVPNRHHLLYGKPIVAGSVVPNRDGDGNGVADTAYSCISCHGKTFSVQRNCKVCHNNWPHHNTAAARARHCKQCHGSLVDNYDDGHYIPSYSPSLVTPRVVGGDGLPLKQYNGVSQGAGACGYCHDDAALGGFGFTEYLPSFVTLHHDSLPDGDWDACAWCHEDGYGDAHDIRRCEACHGPRSLHNIQADSPASGNIGTIVVGAEHAGYGHIGRDMGPGDSDCWGCHGFSMADAPDSGPVIPSVSRVNKGTFVAGAATSVVLRGAAFLNRVGTGAAYESAVTITAPDGTAVTLTPDAIVDQGSLAVTIPAGTKPGKYALRATKSEFQSNPVVLTAVPKVSIAKATMKLQTVTIIGSGFGGYQAGAGLYANGTTSTGATVKGTIVAWGNGRIVAKFGSAPKRVFVRSVFGKASSTVVAQ